MANCKKIIEDATLMLGLKYDKKASMAWGVHRGFTMTLETRNVSNQQQICIALCAGIQGAPIQSGYLQSVRLPDKVRCSTDSFRINMVFAVSGKHDDNVIKVAEATKMMIDFISGNGAVNCDEAGKAGSTAVWRVRGRYAFLSEELAEMVQAKISQNSAVEAEKKENYVLGIVGALLGSVAGGALILLIARLGIISWLCSIVMGLAVVFCYKKLAKKFSIFGFVVCTVVSIAMTFFVFNLDAAISLYQAFQDADMTDMTFGYCFQNVKLLYTLIDAMDTYNHNLILMMLAGIVGALGAGWMEYANQKEQFEMYKVQ